MVVHYWLWGYVDDNKFSSLHYMALWLPVSLTILAWLSTLLGSPLHQSTAMSSANLLVILNLVPLLMHTLYA